MKNSIIKNKYINIIISFIFWIIIWTSLSTLVDNDVLLPMPNKVILSFFNLIFKKNFWISIFNSIYKIILGLLLGIITGILLGTISYNIPLIKNIIEIPIILISSTPIASITVILLIWIHSKNLSIFIVYLIVTPNIYNSTLSSLNDVDYKLLELATVFNVSKVKKIKYIYMDRLKKFLIPSIITSIGLSWKSGISAEVLGLVNNSIGENIYYAKLYLNTSELFAWTFVIIILSKVFEYIITQFILKVI